MNKGKDISTMFTKEENRKNGRLGYADATREKEDIINPAQYGAFLQKRGKRKMRKSALVTDTPKNCYDCPFGTEYCGDSEYEGCCELAECLDSDMRLITEEHYDYESESRPDWCPLVDLPEKDNGDYPANTSDTGFAEGWNQCIDEITGGMD